MEAAIDLRCSFSLPNFYLNIVSSLKHNSDFICYEKSFLLIQQHRAPDHLPSPCTDVCIGVFDSDPQSDFYLCLFFFKVALCVFYPFHILDILGGHMSFHIVSSSVLPSNVFASTIDALKLD